MSAKIRKISADFALAHNLRPGHDFGRWQRRHLRDTMGAMPPPTPARSSRKTTLAFLAIGALFASHFLFSAALQNSADLMGNGGLAEMFLFWGLFALPFITIVVGVSLLVASKLVERFRKRPTPLAWPTAIAVVLGLIIVADGAWDHVPSHRFAAEIVDPVPPSVRNLTIDRATSFCDGSAWFFAFDIDPKDFESIIRQRGLVELPIDWNAFDTEMGFLKERGDTYRIPAFPDERKLLAFDAYHQVPGSRAFKADRLLVVTDPDLRHIQLVRDLWIDRKPTP